VDPHFAVTTKFSDDVHIVTIIDGNKIFFDMEGILRISKGGEVVSTKLGLSESVPLQLHTIY
jgi:hypothetical protein